MQVGTSPQIARSAFLTGIIRRAGRVLEKLMGPAGDEVQVEWSSLGGEGTDAVLYVTLEDAHGVSAATLAIDEFTDSTLLLNRFKLLWDQLLDQGPKSAVIDKLKD